MKVLLLPSFYPSVERPGLGIFFREQAIALARAGCAVEVLHWEPRSLRELSLPALCSSHFQMEEKRVHEVLEVLKRGWNLKVNGPCGIRLWSWLVLRLFRTYVHHHGMPDIVHSHNALAAGFAGRRIQREFGIPYVITEHSTAVSSTQTWTKPFRRILEASYRDAGEVIAVSHALGGAVARIYQNAPIVVPNCVFGDFFTLPPRPRRLDNFQFYCAASLIERKGVHVLLRAFAKAFRGNAGITVTVAGDGPMRTELRELAQALEITDQVTWLGQISRERMREKMWSSHCFVLPSFHETFGVVLIEAMSTGLPVIATHCGGPEEIVDDRSGILLPPGDVDGLARALLEVTQRPWDQAAIRESALSRYDAPVVAGKLIGIYKSVIAGKTVKDRRLSPVEIAS